VRGIQRQIQGVVDGIFGSIRNYLNSLERPELNYDGIKRDVRQMFDDPQAGFEAMRDRLSSFNRETLVAIMSSREDISKADANRIIDQIEGARNKVLQRAERIQQEAQRRLEEVKQQAQRQAEETASSSISSLVAVCNGNCIGSFRRTWRSDRCDDGVSNKVVSAKFI
jgi:nucleoid DNA-binding protein